MSSASGFAGLLVAYTAARLSIIAAVACLLVLAGVPLLVAVLIGVVAALPLALVLLRGLRGRLDVAMAAAQARRGAQREVLRARLRGDDLSDRDRSDEAAPHEPRAGQD